MKKILILSNSSSGLYEFRNEIVLDMLKDHEVHISLPDADRYFDILDGEGCIMHHTPFERRGMNPVKDIRLLRCYLSLIKEVNPDIVCTYTIKPNIYGGLACRLTKTPYIVNITGLGTAIQGGGQLAKLLIVMYKVATTKATRIFFQNDYNMQFMRQKGIAVNNADLLPGSGVNLELHTYKPYPTETEALNILSVMRIMKDKGIEELFDVIDRIGNKTILEVTGDQSTSKDARIHFLLAGNYEEETRDKYEPILTQLVDEGKLSFLGYIDDMDAIYSKCHIVLHPSYHEGLSNVCLEAAANGRMVLTTDIPGCRETVRDGLSGMLFEARSKESAYNTVKAALAYSNTDREDMGKNGWEYVSANYDRNIVVGKYRKLIDSI